MNSELDRMIRSYGQELEWAQRRQPARPRFPVRRVVLAGALAGLAGGIAVAVLPDEGPVGVLAKAQAAITIGDKIEHTRVETYSYSGSEPKHPKIEMIETWSRASPPVSRELMQGPDGFDARAEDGMQTVYFPAQAKVFRNQPIPAANMTNTVDQIRRRLRDGTMHPAGSVLVDGRKLLRLARSVSETSIVQRGDAYSKFEKVTQTTDYQYDVDPRSYTPVRLRIRIRSSWPGSSRHVAPGLVVVMRFRLYELLPPTPRNLKQLEIRVPAGTKVVG